MGVRPAGCQSYAIGKSLAVGVRPAGCQSMPLVRALLWESGQQLSVYAIGKSLLSGPAVIYAIDKSLLWESASRLSVYAIDKSLAVGVRPAGCQSMPLIRALLLGVRPAGCQSMPLIIPLWSPGQQAVSLAMVRALRGSQASRLSVYALVRALLWESGQQAVSLCH